MSPEELLIELGRLGGTFKVLAEAQLLQLRKGADYNAQGREVYYPFGLQSHLTMINTKNQRLLSLALNQQAGQAPNFEGLRDTALDLINYVAYMVEFIDKAQENLDVKTRKE